MEVIFQPATTAKCFDFGRERQLVLFSKNSSNKEECWEKKSQLRTSILIPNSHQQDLGNSFGGEDLILVSHV
jgi:hypothetical protein